jgi:hypothetical protein
MNQPQTANHTNVSFVSNHLLSAAGFAPVDLLCEQSTLVITITAWKRHQAQRWACGREEKERIIVMALDIAPSLNGGRYSVVPVSNSK